MLLQHLLLLEESQGGYWQVLDWDNACAAHAAKSVCRLLHLQECIHSPQHTSGLQAATHGIAYCISTHMAMLMQALEMEPE